nr:unnamed protein product [Digitaria exilis]
MAGPHVLIVDDACVDRLVASRVLESCNIRGISDSQYMFCCCYFVVTVVEGAMQAMRFLAKEQDVQLILTDYSMPDMTGYDLLVEVKNSPRLNHIPVVITCTDYVDETVQMCLDGGAADFITKPIVVADVPCILSYIV